MPGQTKYDVAVVGGGLAGLALSIQLAQKNYSVVLFEKEKYPFHKVCGEYISMESWNFLEELGVPLSNLELPKIDTLKLTSPNGRSFTTKLPLGGFGVSRYRLDSLLAAIATESGVRLLDETKVDDVQFYSDKYFVKYFSKGGDGVKKIEASACAGAYGKRSNIDIKWKRNFVKRKNSRRNNYVAVKYHIKTDWPANVIGLHNFDNGYCGISRIEDEKYCLCYLTTSENLRRSGNSIQAMQENILYENPVLRKLFSSSEFIFSSPLTISQISFDKKLLIENNLLMVGDAAGMISPLCGNGMSMALYSSKMAAQEIDLLLKKKADITAMENQYAQKWKHEFSKRLMTGRILQSFFGSPVSSNLLVALLNTFPFLATNIIKKTHGKPF